MACWSCFSIAWGISIRITVTLSVMSDSLSLQSSRSMIGVLLWFQGFGYGCDYIIIMIIVFTYLDVDMGQRSACVMRVLVCRCKHSN
jgi:hypothetical protein